MVSFLSLAASFAVISKMEMNLLFCLFVICIWNFQHISMTELVFDRAELLNGSFVEGFYHNAIEYRISKLNRTTYVLNGDIEFFVTLDDSYDMEVNFYFNRLNNNQYEKSFISIKRDSICNMDKHRNILFTKKNENSTNWITPGKSFCPLEKVSFEFKLQN